MYNGFQDIIDMHIYLVDVQLIAGMANLCF